MLPTPNTCSYNVSSRSAFSRSPFSRHPEKGSIVSFSSKPDLILFGDLKFKLVQLSSFYHCHFGEKYGQPSPAKTPVEQRKKK